MVLLAEDRYAFDGTATGEAVTDVPAGSTPGAHGYVNTDPGDECRVRRLGSRNQEGRQIGFDSQSGCRSDHCAPFGLRNEEHRGSALTEDSALERACYTEKVRKSPRKVR